MKGYRAYILLVPQATPPETDESVDTDCGPNAVWLNTDGKIYVGPSNSLILAASVDTLTNKNIIGPTNVVECNALKTTGSAIDVSASAPPTAAQVLTCTTPTTATWTTPAPTITGPGTSTNDGIVKWNGTTGMVLSDTPNTIDINNDLNLVKGLYLPITSSAGAGVIYLGRDPPDEGDTDGLPYLHGYTPGGPLTAPPNMFVGFYSGNLTLTSTGCACFGSFTGQVLTSGTDNTFIGFNAGHLNTTGYENTCIGHYAGSRITTGFRNVFLGDSNSYLSTGNNNVCLGSSAGTALSGPDSNNIAIGCHGVSGDNHIIRIGDVTAHTKNFQMGIRGVTTTNADAVPVLIDSAGQLGTVSSSIIYKENVCDLPSTTSELIYNLRPVQFNYKSHPSTVLKLGLIAEEVEKVYPDMCIYEDVEKTKLLTVDYQSLVPMMLSELQTLRTQVDVLMAR